MGGRRCPSLLTAAQQELCEPPTAQKLHLKFLQAQRTFALPELEELLADVQLLLFQSVLPRRLLTLRHAAHEAATKSKTKLAQNFILPMRNPARYRP